MIVLATSIRRSRCRIAEEGVGRVRVFVAAQVWDTGGAVTFRFNLFTHRTRVKTSYLSVMLWFLCTRHCVAETNVEHALK